MSAANSTTSRRSLCHGWYDKAVRRALIGIEAYQARANATVMLKAAQADATALSLRIRKKVDAVITSPPYNIAVNYYRRHQLEMFWLGLTRTQADRLALLP